jgi:hypothetical protein
MGNITQHFGKDDDDRVFSVAVSFVARETFPTGSQLDVTGANPVQIEGLKPGEVIHYDKMPLEHLAAAFRRAADWLDALKLLKTL